MSAFIPEQWRELEERMQQIAADEINATPPKTVTGNFAFHFWPKDSLAQFSLGFCLSLGMVCGVSTAIGVAFLAHKIIKATLS